MSLLPRCAAWVLLGCALLSCSDAGLYALDGRGPGGRDRADFSGRLCMPLAGGESFPVKVLFAVQGGEGVPAEMVGFTTDALGTLSSRFSVPYIRFSLVAFHTVATGLLGRFGDASELQATLPRYAAYQETGPVSLRAPLRLARSMLSGDMLTGCPGTIARTRYLVVLLITSGDTSCANPAFNAGIDSRCRAFLDDDPPEPDQLNACSRCELTAVTDQLKALARQYGAGEVTVQPIYVRTTVDPEVSRQVAAIANSGGTEPIETDPANLRNVLGSLNYASLQARLALKRLVAFNRNVQVRANRVLADSDGDGVADEDEEALGLQAKNPDSDFDGLMDGVELRMGLKPQEGNIDVIPSCNPSLDSDGDRLTDCEERVLGTDSCVGDTDGDGLPDLVEAFANTNPLVPEDLLDGDKDGISNIEEVIARGDPLSADLGFHADRAQGYQLLPAEPSEDGRACFNVRVENVSLVSTLDRPNPLFPSLTIPAGTNDVYLYMQSGRANDPRGSGIGSLFVDSLRFVPPQGLTPPGARTFQPEDFVLSP